MKRILSFIVALITMACAGTPAVQAGSIINEYLPEWAEIDVQLRHRYEWKSDFDFNKAVEDDKGFSLWRVRVSTLLKPTDDIRFFYQFQDSRITNDSIGGSKAAFEDWMETRQLWLQYIPTFTSIEPIDLTSAGFRFGRQELSYGAQRLLGGFNWSNIAQTFDAGKIILEFADGQFKLDFFAGDKTPNKSPRESDDLFDGSSNDDLAGYYGVYRHSDHLTVEQYMLHRNTEGKTVSFGQTGDGEVEDYTIGGRIKGIIPDTAFDFEIEAAKQFGNSGALDVDAQMAVFILGYTFDIPWKPRIAFEFDYASGDGNASDSERETFQNLYPTNHLFYGYMDFASLQNINNYRFQITAKPCPKLKLQADYHLIYLDTPDDNLYSAGRAIKRATAAGASSSVGQEIDLLVKYKVCDYANLMVGYSHFFAGDYLEDTGTAEDADFFYVQTVLSF